MTIGPPCPRCGRSTHLTHAIGWFSQTVPTYAADYDGAPVRDTRDAARQDQCDHQAARKEPQS